LPGSSEKQVPFIRRKISLQMICFITGGARSGKSRYAQQSALAECQNPVYVATAAQYSNDLEFSERIKRHQSDRDGRWTNYEEPLHPSRLKIVGRTVVLDCVTLWLSNYFTLTKSSVEESLRGIRREIDLLAAMDSKLFIVSNEIGMGVHAETEIGRRFTDLQGMANQYIAAKADKVILMISGLPLIVKQSLL
jgi:adenosylcobinamide kinase/adenosylcobinamide-phosphate guanylyltransferase